MPNVKEVTFDRVHDTQYIYRELLDVMARPGRIGSIASAAGKLELPDAGQRTAAALALTLLDGEVSFAVAEDNGSQSFDTFADAGNGNVSVAGAGGPGLLEGYIRRQTFCRATPVDEADYVLAAGMMQENAVRAVMGVIRRGTLLAPERGATLLMQVEHLAPAGVAGTGADRGTGAWVLQGPGIQDNTRLAITGMNKLWIEERVKVNAEYPMGIDVVLFTADGLIAALPRTTVIREELA